MSKNCSKTCNDLELSELLEAQVILSSKSCPKNEEQTLAVICGHAFWNQFIPGEPNKLGTLMKRLVTNKRVPFVFVGTNSENHALYRLANEEV